MFFVGCSTDMFIADDGGDGGDPGDALQMDSPLGSDGATDGAVSPDGSPTDAGGGDGSDGFTLPKNFRVFVTSEIWSGNLGGLAGADAKCTAAASKLGGKWMAWLSTSTNSPALRFTSAKSPYDTIPYVLVDGTPLASDWAHLTGKFGLQNAINRDESGALAVFDGSYPGYVMTSTDSTGGASLNLGCCSDYTSTSGTTTAGTDTSKTDQTWTLASQWNCNSAASVYCFEQP